MEAKYGKVEEEEVKDAKNLNVKRKKKGSPKKETPTKRRKI